MFSISNAVLLTDKRAAKRFQKSELYRFTLLSCHRIVWKITFMISDILLHFGLSCMLPPQVKVDKKGNTGLYITRIVLYYINFLTRIYSVPVGSQMQPVRV